MPKLNILKHKSFHVLNKDNVERVRKDEAEHQKKIDEERARLKKIEGERRLELLRSKKNGSKPQVQNVDDDDNIVSTDKEMTSEKIEVGTNEGAERGTHVNFFEFEEKINGATVNEEREVQEKREKERLERQMTNWHLDTGLKDAPWYSKSSINRGSSGSSRDKRLKHRHDPIRIIEQATAAGSGLKRSETATATKSNDVKSLSKIERMRMEKQNREEDERRRKEKLLSERRKDL